jgi:hypothetical protein
MRFKENIKYGGIMKKIILLCIFLLMFVTLLIAQAPEWQWANQAGSTGTDEGKEIAIDADGNSIVTGSFTNTATFGSYTLTSSGNSDIFVAKMDTNGNWLWATKAGGTDVDNGNGIEVDTSGNSYVTGYFNDTATFGSYSLTSSAGYDIFVAKIDANGNWLWATQAGGLGSDIGYAIALDFEWNCYVTGHFSTTATFGSYTLPPSGNMDIFVAKMNSDGNWLWATQAGGTLSIHGYGISIDAVGSSYITGDLYGTGTFGTYTLISDGVFDIFVAKVDANGNWLWATKAGGTNYNFGYGIATDSSGNSYITGSTSGTATFGSYSLISSNRVIFVAKMDVNGNWLWATGASESLSYGMELQMILMVTVL